MPRHLFRLHLQRRGEEVANASVRDHDVELASLLADLLDSCEVPGLVTADKLEDVQVVGVLRGQGVEVRGSCGVARASEDSGVGAASESGDDAEACTDRVSVSWRGGGSIERTNATVSARDEVGERHLCEAM